jgi:hypothetical protein
MLRDVLEDVTTVLAYRRGLDEQGVLRVDLAVDPLARGT